MRFDVIIERGDGWDKQGKLVRERLLVVRNVETLEEAERFYRYFYVPFTGDCRSQSTSGNWKLEDGTRIVKTFSADVKDVDNWPNAKTWGSGHRTSVSVSIIEHE